MITIWKRAYTQNPWTGEHGWSWARVARVHEQNAEAALAALRAQNHEDIFVASYRRPTEQQGIRLAASLSGMLV